MALFVPGEADAPLFDKLLRDSVVVFTIRIVLFSLHGKLRHW